MIWRRRRIHDIAFSCSQLCINNLDLARAPKSRAPKTISNAQFTTRLPKLHFLAALPPVFKCHGLVDQRWQSCHKVRFGQTCGKFDVTDGLWAPTFWCRCNDPSRAGLASCGWDKVAVWVKLRLGWTGGGGEKVVNECVSVYVCVYKQSEKDFSRETHTGTRSG